MIFAEEMKMNLHYGGFQQHNNPSNFASNPMEMNTAIWEPPGYSDTSSSNASLGYNNDAGGSKLITKWAQPVGTTEVGGAKNSHQEAPMHGQPSAPFAPPGFPVGGQGGFVWNEPTYHFPPQQPQDQMLHQQAKTKFAPHLNLKANAFHPSMPMPPTQGPPLGGHFTPQVELLNGQWGSAEINQATPWNLEMNGMDPNIQQPQRYQEWDGVVDNAGAFVDAVGYGGPAPYGGMQMHPYGGVGMSGAGNTFGPPPQFNGVPANNRTGPPQRWNMGGPGIGRPRGVAGPPGRMFTNNGGLPPRPNHNLGMPLTQLLPSRNPHGIGSTPTPYNVNQFVPPDGYNNIQAAGFLNDDESSVWQDPNAVFKKWQRDTGTCFWGDPDKQTGIQIQRWQQFTDEDEIEIVAKSSSKEGAVVDGGWGELPPIRSSNSSTNNGSTISSGVNSGQQFIPPQHQGQQHQPQQHSNKTNGHQGTGGEVSNSTWGQQESQSTSTSTGQVSLAEELSSLGGPGLGGTAFILDF